MALRNSTPLKFSPSTVCDAVDSTDLPPGAMQNLVNLIPDPTTKNVFQCRPAVRLLTNFNELPAGLPESTVPTLDNLRFAANRARWPNGAVVNKNQIMVRKGHRAWTDISELKVGFPVMRISPQDNDLEEFSFTPGVAEAVVTASIEYPAGTTTQLLFSASPTGTAVGGTVLFSDLLTLGFTIPAGEIFWVRTFYNMATVGVYFNTFQDNATYGDESESGTGGLTDKTLTGSIINDGSFSYGPACILAETGRVSFCCIGDSITEGVADTSEAAPFIGNVGMVCKALAAIAPMQNMGLGGTFLMASPPFGLQPWGIPGSARSQLVPYGTDFIIELGTNDLDIFLGNRTAAQVSSDLQSLITSTLPGFGMATGAGIYLTTVLPYTTSTDGWITVSGQTTTGNSVQRIAYNNLIRMGMANVTSYFDTADILMSARDSDLWLAPPAVTGDGLHPNNTGYAIGSTAIFVPGGTTPGMISCIKVLGTRVYGMIATALNPGRDQPFAFDIVNNSFITVTGITVDNTPLSPPETGPWTPPTMDLIGAELMVTHPGYNGDAGVYFGWFDLTDPNVPTWHGGNLTGGFVFTTTVPSAVKNFNGRAYWMVNPLAGQPGVVFSDVLVPRNVTSGTQVITFDDNVPLTALGTLNLQNQLGGVIQALVVFKGTSNVYQITGDAAANNLARNALNITTGTLAPNSVCNTPKGLAFVSPEGVRIIDFNAYISDPLGNAGLGITVPFINALVPSRISGACGGTVMRMATQNENAPGAPKQEFWFDFARLCWTGPHTCVNALAQPYKNSFVITLSGINSALYVSDVVQSAASTFVENGVNLTWTWTTSLLPDTEQMAENAMIETTLYLQLNAAMGVIQLAAVDQEDVDFDSVNISLDATGSSIWGAFTWGVDTWGGIQVRLYPRQLLWTKPIVFRRMAITATGNSVSFFEIGRLAMRYEQLGYLQQGGGAQG